MVIATGVVLPLVPVSEARSPGNHRSDQQSWTVHCATTKREGSSQCELNCVSRYGLCHTFGMSSNGVQEPGLVVEPEVADLSP